MSEELVVDQKVRATYIGRQFGDGKSVNFRYEIEDRDGNGKILSFNSKLSPVHEVGGVYHLVYKGEGRYASSKKRRPEDQVIEWLEDKGRIALLEYEDLFVESSLKADKIKTKLASELKTSLKNIRYLYIHSSQYDKIKIIKAVVDFLMS